MQQNLHYWLLAMENGLQFRECGNCGHSNTLEHHFDATGGDVVECEECDAPHEITTVPPSQP